MTFVVALCDHKARLWASTVSLVSASNESMKWRRPIWVRTITFSHTQPPMIHKTLRDENGTPTDLLWCKNITCRTQGPQPSSFGAKTLRDEHRAPTDLLWCKKRAPNDLLDVNIHHVYYMYYIYDCKKTVLFTFSLITSILLWRYFIRRHIFLRGFEEIILRLCQHPQKLMTKSYKNQENFGSNSPCPENRYFWHLNSKK